MIHIAPYLTNVTIYSTVHRKMQKHLTFLSLAARTTPTLGFLQGVKQLVGNLH